MISRSRKVSVLSSSSIRSRSRLLLASLSGASVPVVFDELAEAAVVAFADRAIEADRVAADVEHAFGFFEPDAGGERRFLGRRLAAHFLQQLLGRVAQLHQHVDHVDRDPDRAGLIGDRPGDRLANPPRGVGART